MEQQAHGKEGQHQAEAAAERSAEEPASGEHVWQREGGPPGVAGGRRAVGWECGWRAGRGGRRRPPSPRPGEGGGSCLGPLRPASSAWQLMHHPLHLQATSCPRRPPMLLLQATQAPRGSSLRTSGPIPTSQSSWERARPRRRTPARHALLQFSSVPRPAGALQSVHGACVPLLLMHTCWLGLRSNVSSPWPPAAASTTSEEAAVGEAPCAQRSVLLIRYSGRCTRSRCASISLVPLPGALRSYPPADFSARIVATRRHPRAQPPRVAVSKPIGHLPSRRRRSTCRPACRPVPATCASAAAMYEGCATCARTPAGSSGSARGRELERG